MLGDFGIVLFVNSDAARLTSTFGEKVGTTDWMAPWARVKRRLEEVVPSFDVFPLGKVLWSMVSGQPDLPFWYWQKPEYHLEQLFQGESEMRFVNKILQQTVVEDEEDCLPSAAELLGLVDAALVALRHGGQPISDGLSRRCLVCGLGRYVADAGGKPRRLALIPAKDDGQLNMGVYTRRQRMKRLLTAGCVGMALAWASVSGLATGTVTAAATGEGALVGLQETTSTVLDGVFTAAQARRGRRVYTQNCVSCHGPWLKGGEMAPSIAGSDFIVFWIELPVGSLFERIRVSMPADGPALTDEEYTDVVAYLLDANDYPAGDQELPADKTALDMIMIVAAE